MALRLTDLPASRPAARPGAGTLAARAAGALREGDLRAYRELFREAAAIGDPHDRYRARRHLIESALAAAGEVGAAGLPPLFTAAAEQALAMLAEEPREPLILNYAGVALYEIGALDGARALFEAALRLDPELPHVQRNLDELARRRRRGAVPRLPRAVAVTLPTLERRARQAAAGARPVEGLTLSLCMIVKDEEAMLPRSLTAVRDAVDEIVVVDTGSSDRTIEIAREFGARVIEREWTGSFADARNASFDAASGDWVMYLDADEVLVEEDVPLLRELTGRVWREAFYLVETNHTGDAGDGTAVTHNALRVFRNRPEYRFEGRIHEQIAHRLPSGLPERLEPTRVRVEHFGYLGAVRDAKGKSRRNIELLERQAAEQGMSPFMAYNLGSEHAAAGDAAAALEHFARAWSLLRAEPDFAGHGFAPSLLGRLVKALRVNGRLDEAERQAAEGLDTYPGFTDLVFEQATVARMRGQRRRAAELLERCLEMGDGPSRYSATVGCGSYLALVALAEVHRQLGDRDEAERLLRRCLAEHPGFLGSVLPLAEVLLAGGREPPAVAEEIESRVRELTPSISFMLGTALYEAGHAEEAEPRFRAVLERQPGSDPARLALCEALLSRGRFHEAAIVAAAVADGAPLAPAASRSELFALIAAGDDARDALARAGRRGVPAHDLALLAAWEGALRGESLPRSLPPAAADLLLVVLEALLRVREFEAFEALLPALDRVGLPWRRRRELLARMYLRRGFLESAADEWIAVCHEADPDGDALVGLAQVAVARGMAEDALTFAREAETLEPGRADAARLVACLK